eukprot:12138177-Alexandrium_andersonii.AAC.1
MHSDGTVALRAAMQGRQQVNCCWPSGGAAISCKGETSRSGNATETKQPGGKPSRQRRKRPKLRRH